MLGMAGKPQWTFIVGIAALMAAGAVLFFSLPAAADTGPPQPWDITDPLDIIVLFFVNYVINLFLFTGLFLLFASVWGKKVGKLEPNSGRFMLLVLAGTAIITLFGFLIDLVFVTPSYFGIQPLDLAYAAVLIFVSIVIIAYYLLKICKWVSILIGLGIVAANLASWSAILHPNKGTPRCLPWLIVVPPLLLMMLIIMYRWHRKVLTTG